MTKYERKKNKTQRIKLTYLKNILFRNIKDFYNQT